MNGANLIRVAGELVRVWQWDVVEQALHSFTHAIVGHSGTTPTMHTQAHTVTNPSHIEPLVGQYFIVAANVKAAVLCLDPQQRGVGSNKQHQVAITLDREPLRSTRTHAHHTTRCKRQAT